MYTCVLGFLVAKLVKKVKVKSLSPVRLFATPWAVAYQAPLSMGFCRQECWSGWPFPSAGDLPNPGIKPRSPALQSDSLPTELWSNPLVGYNPCGHKKVGHNLVTKQQATLLLAKEESVGSDCSSLKSNKQAKLVERKNCFISDASNWGGWWQTSVQRLTLPCPAPSGKRFLDRRAGRATCRKQHSQLWQSSSNWSSVVWPASSWLF